MDERYLHRSAKKAVQALQTRANRDPSIVSPAIQGLVLMASGLYNFDTITKTKTIAKLLSVANLSSLEDLVPAVCEVIEQPEATDEKEADAKRRSFADILVSICARTVVLVNGQNEDPNPVAEMVLATLIGLAYSNKSLRPGCRMFKPLPSFECRKYLRSRIKTCLDQSSQHRATKLCLLRHTIHRLKDVQEQADHEHAIVEFDEQTEKIVEKAWKRLRKVTKTVSLTIYLATDMVLTETADLRSKHPI